jgi:hypothetical protein
MPRRLHFAVLRNAKDFLKICVRILDFGAGRHPTDINNRTRHVRARNKTGLPWKRNSVWKISFRDVSGRCTRCRGRVWRWCAFRWSRRIWIERLLLRRTSLGLSLVRIFCHAMANALWRLIHIRTRREKESSEQRERQQEFHKSRCDEITVVLIQCQSLNRFAGKIDHG